MKKYYKENLFQSTHSNFTSFDIILSLYLTKSLCMFRVSKMINLQYQKTPLLGDSEILKQYTKNHF